MKIIGILLCVLLLSGCGAQPVFETISDVSQQPVMAQPGEVSVLVPDGTAVETIATGDKLYFCGDMTVSIQTFAGGDLGGTIRSVTGFEKENLQIMEYADTTGKCYECAWVTLGEGQMQVAQTKIIDDGTWHYAITAIAPQNAQMQDQMRQILDSVSIGS